MTSLFSAAVPRYHLKSAVEFDIQVTYNVTGTTWTLQKRFSEFDSLLKTLAETHHLLPDLPQKTLWKKSDPDFLERRRILLQEFMQVLLKRRELATSPEVSAFLSIHKNLPEVLLYLPNLTHTAPIGLVVRSVTADGNNLYCLGREESPVSRFETYFKNWRSKQTDPIGSAFLLKQDSHDVAWKLPFLTYPTALCWEPALTVLACGLDDGRVVCVRVCTELDHAKYEPYCELHPHYQAVVGLALDYTRAYLYSCGQDNRLCICELNSESLVAEMQLPGPTISAFAVFQGRAFLATEVGQVHVYDISPSTLVYRATLNPSVGSPVKAIVVCELFIATGHDTGAVSLYANTARFNPDAPVRMLQGSPKAKALVLAGNELFVGTKSGCITAWDLQLNRMVYSWKAHIGGVYGLSWDSSARILHSGGWDRTLKTWQLAEFWQSPEVLSQQTQFLAGAEVQSPVRRSAYEDDDLMGWDS
jgi:WD40 repeat protein